MYDFSLEDFETDDRYLNASPDEQKQYSRDYLKENGTDEVFSRFDSYTTSDKFTSLPEEDQSTFTENYFDFYGVDKPLEDVSFLTDIKDVALSGLSGTSAVPKMLGVVSGWLGFDDTKDYLLDVAKTTSEFYNEKMSDQGKDVTEQAFLSDKDGQWFGDNAIKKVFMTSAESIPLMAVTAPVGGVISAGLSKAKFLPTFIRALEGSGKASKWSHRLLSFGSSEAGTAALVSAADAGVKIDDMSEQDRLKSPVYRELLKTMSPEDAKEEFRGIVEIDAFKSQAMANLLGSAVAPGGVLPRLLGKTGGKGLFKNVAAGTVEEALQEGPQSGLEKVAQNISDVRMLGEKKSLWEGVVEDIALGAASGGTTGGSLTLGKGLVSVGDISKTFEDVPIDAAPEEIVDKLEEAKPYKEIEPEKLSVGPEFTDYELEDLEALSQKVDQVGPEELKVFLERLTTSKQRPEMKRAAMQIVQDKIGVTPAQVPISNETAEPVVPEEYFGPDDPAAVKFDPAPDVSIQREADKQKHIAGIKKLKDLVAKREFIAKGKPSTAEESAEVLKKQTDSMVAAEDRAGKQDVYEEVFDDLTPTEIKPGVQKITEQLAQKDNAGLIVEGTGNEAEVIGGYPSTAPDWMKQKSIKLYDKKNGTEYAKIVNESSVSAVIKKVKEGKALTVSQGKVYDYIKDVALNLQGSDKEVLADKAFQDIEDQGFELFAEKNVIVGNMKKGDKVVVIEKGVPEVFEHKGRKNDTGDILLQDGVEKYVDEFDILKVVGEQKNKPVVKEPEVKNELEISRQEPQSKEAESIAKDDDGRDDGGDGLLSKGTAAGEKSSVKTGEANEQIDRPLSENISEPVVSADKKTKSQLIEPQPQKELPKGKEVVPEKPTPDKVATPPSASEIATAKSSTPVGDVGEKVKSKSSIVSGEEMPAPTEAQKTAGNYKKLHVSLDGMDISIENTAGSTRSGTDEDGKDWSVKIKNDYGYIKGTVGKDKDHLDVFVAPNYKGGADTVYIVNQYNKDGTFDEHKIVLGPKAADDALVVYNANYEKGWTGGKSVTPMSLKVFKKWSTGNAPSKGAVIRKSTVEIKPTDKTEGSDSEQDASGTQLSAPVLDFVSDVESANFKKWSGGAEIREGSEISEAKPNTPYVFKVYHGTTHEFSVFDPSLTGNKEGAFGAVNYFTSDRGDADVNYAGEGPDLSNRIDLLAEQIEDGYAPDKYNIDPDEAEAAEGNVEASRQLASEALQGEEPRRLDVYVKMDNPVFVNGDTVTWIENDVREQYREDAIEEIKTQEDATDEQIEDGEFDDQIEEYINESAVYDESPIQEAISDALRGYDVQGFAGSELSLYPEVDASELYKELSESLSILEDPETGDMVGQHVVGQIFKNLGFDGIVLQNANEKFPNMGMGGETSHVHVFEETPQNIKSATGNSGEYSLNNPDIMLSLPEQKTKTKINAKKEYSKLGTREYIKKHGSKKLKASYFILERILPKGMLDDIVVNINTESHPTGTLGIYDSSTKTVEMYSGENVNPESFANTLLHEAVHSITYDKLQYDAATNKELDKLRNKVAGLALSKEELKIYKRFSGDPHGYNAFISSEKKGGKSYSDLGIEDQGKARAIYMLLSNDEFLANATHPAMQDLLSNVPVTKKNSFMAQVKAIFKKIFGWTNKQYTAYEQAMSTIGELNKEISFTLKESPVKPLSDFTSSNDQVSQYAAKTKYHDMFERAVMFIADRDDPRRRVYNRATRKAANNDILTVERLRGSKTATAVKQLMKQRVEPMLKILGKNKISTDELGEYAHAKTAPERNKRMREVNAKRYIDEVSKNLNSSEKKTLKNEMIDIRSDVLMSGGSRSERQNAYLNTLSSLFNNVDKQEADLNATRSLMSEREFTPKEVEKGTEDFLLKRIDSRQKNIDNIKSIRGKWKAESPRYSGITDPEARDILKKWNNDSRIDAMKDVHGKLLELIKSTLNVLRESGQISEAEYKSLVSGYKYYVPLLRDVEDSTSPPTGRITGPTGNPLKVAKGSMKEVVNVFANSVSNAQAAIVRKYKAEGGERLIQFVKDNPNAGITLGKQEKKPTHDKEGNLVMFESPAEADNELYVRSDGKRYVLTFDKKDKQVMRFLESIKDSGVSSSNAIQFVSKITRFMAALNTTFSPEFITTNFSKDIQTAMIHLEDSSAKGLQKKVLKNVFPAIKGILGAEFKGKGGKWGEIYRDFQEQGAQIGWMQSYENVDDLASSLESSLDMFKEGHVPKKMFNKTAEAIQNVNVAIENGVRLATYKALLDIGIPKEKAAKEVKDLTVDFNRKGTASPVINSLYLFFNAGVQGNIRVGKALARSPKARALTGSIVISGFALQMLGYMAGDDETGEPLIDSVPDYIRERNIVFVKKDGSIVKIPMPYVYNVFFNIGSEMAKATHAAMNNKKFNAAKSAMRLGSVAMNTLNPLQSATLFQTLTPSFMDPLTMIEENKKWTGSKLMPETNQYGPKKSDAYRFWKSTPQVFKSISQTVNKLTGGEGEYGDKGISVSPESLQLWYESYTGAAGKFVKDVFTSSWDFYRGNDVETRRIPFVRKFVGDKNDRAISDRYYEKVNDIKTFENNLDLDKSLNSDPRKKLIRITKAYERKISKIRKNIRKSTGDEERVKRLKESILKKQTEYLKRLKNG